MDNVVTRFGLKLEPPWQGPPNTTTDWRASLGKRLAQSGIHEEVYRDHIMNVVESELRGVD